jgi:hypothetical protein
MVQCNVHGTRWETESSGNRPRCQPNKWEWYSTIHTYYITLCYFKVSRQGMPWIMPLLGHEFFFQYSLICDSSSSHSVSFHTVRKYIWSIVKKRSNKSVYECQKGKWKLTFLSSWNIPRPISRFSWLEITDVSGIVSIPAPSSGSHETYVIFNQLISY